MFTRACKAEDFPAIFKLVNAACEADRTRRVLEPTFRQDYFSGPTGKPTERGVVVVNFDATLAGFAWWEENADPYTLAVQGWVDPAWRGQGAGSALLKAVERYAERSGQPQVRMNIRTYGDLADTVALVQHFGYEEVRRFYKMSVDLTGKRFEVTPPAGVTLGSFQLEHLNALVEADNTFFAEHWGSHAVNVAEWQHRMIAMRPHDPALWVIAWADEQIVGECLCHASLQDGPDDGWVGIVGVRNTWRGRGLGQAVLASGLHRLQSAGFKTASLHVDADNTSALNLYRRMGMDVARISLVFRKTLHFR